MSGSYDWILVIETPGHAEIYVLRIKRPILLKCVINALFARPHFVPGICVVLCAVH